jgi:SAM-dependent methyltransferase
VSFDVSADAYGRFMGRFSVPLATTFADQAGVRAGQRALDVGCGPGALIAELVDRLGPTVVAAIDPSASFVTAAQTRFPGVTVTSGVAEDLPFPDDSFDITLAQLVVHFMRDPVAGLTEMRRVTRVGGRLGACVWDHAGNAGPLSLFWRAVGDLDPAASGEAGLAGTAEGQLLSLAGAAGWRDLEETLLTVSVAFPTFDDWWAPFLLGVGPAGAYIARLDPPARDALRDRCAELLPAAPFQLSAAAWTVFGRA